MKLFGNLVLLTGLLVLQGCCALGFVIHDKRTARQIEIDAEYDELSEVAEASKEEPGIIVRLKSDVLFDTGKTDLTSTSYKQIQRLADVLKKHPGNQITVVGNTDNVGSQEDNMVLSRDRAQAVKMALVNDGVEPKAVISRGMGETDPLVPNDSDEHRAKNRRAELKIAVVE